jgi:hypothetical protein
MSTSSSEEQILHKELLPFTATELKEHFAPVAGDEHGDPERHLAAWRSRIAKASGEAADFLDRDETMWTAGSLIKVHRSTDREASWASLLSTAFGPRPPIEGLDGWQECVSGDLNLFLEVGLPSPRRYQDFLRRHMPERHPLHRRVGIGETQTRPVEGRTHLDALLLNRSNGFALHVESKVLSDIDTKITFDALRNQLVRNLDCMAEPPRRGDAVLGARDPRRSLFALLTPELFRRNWRSRLYGHLLREYQTDPAALQRDLPHRSGAECASLSRRIGWIAFEDIAAEVPGACAWLDPGPANEPS